jgi:hypothetical protein
VDEPKKHMEDLRALIAQQKAYFAAGANLLGRRLPQ